MLKRTELVQFDDLLPSFTIKSIPELFTEFEVITSRNGVLLGSLSFNDLSKSSGKGDYKTVNAKLSVIGEYEALKNFAKALEYNKHLMDITSISLGMASPRGGSDESESEESVEPESESVPKPEQETELFSFGMSVNVYYK